MPFVSIRIYQRIVDVIRVVGAVEGYFQAAERSRNANTKRTEGAFASLSRENKLESKKGWAQNGDSAMPTLRI